MLKKISGLAAGVALLALASVANAAQPMALSDKQMDVVTAGGVGIANAGSVAFGEVLADTFSQTSTNVNTATGLFAIGQAFSQSLAAGGFLFQAAAISHADTAASLP
jgi:hypothetical protein